MWDSQGMSCGGFAQGEKVSLAGLSLTVCHSIDKQRGRLDSTALQQSGGASRKGDSEVVAFAEQARERDADVVEAPQAQMRPCWVGTILILPRAVTSLHFTSRHRQAGRQ